MALICMLALCVQAQAKVEDVRPGGERPQKPPEQTTKSLGLLGKLLSPTPQLAIVPIPQSNPTLGTGLTLAAIYFHSQSEEQKRAQPPSSTQGFAMYTNSDSYAYGIQQQSFWDQDRWRFDGILAQGLFNLKFFGVGADAGDRDESIDWKLRGIFLMPRLLRKIKGDWYLGGQVRYVNTSQSFGGNIDLGEGLLGKVTTPELDATSVGLGALVQHDTRDNRFNAYKGSFLQLNATVFGEAIGGDFNYQSVELRYRYYQSLDESKVLALDGRVCGKGGDVPFYDLCFLQLRGIPVTQYIDDTMFSAQGELRWRFQKRLGMVGFVGAGEVVEDITEVSTNDLVYSYGAGLRFSLLPTQRINLRIDYARSSKGGDAVYLSVTEAF